MRNRFILVSLLLLLSFFAPFHVAWAFGDTVETITVHVVSSDAQPPDRVAKRMATSIKTVGEHLVTGHKVEEVIAGRTSYEKLVKEVFDRVLVGYFVSDVAIEPGIVTNITVDVEPWGDVVKSVKLQVDFQNLSPEAVSLIRQDMGNIEDNISNVLVGLPVDAVEWAGGVSKNMIRDMLSAQLPEFYANLEIVPGTDTLVKLSLSPTGPVIRDTHVAIRSGTIPNLLLLEARPALEGCVQGLNGLPVAFVERHRDFFLNKIKSTAAAQPVTARYGLVLTPDIYAGSDTEVVLKAETTKYKVWIESYMDMGRKEDNTSLKFHAGKLVSSRDELFTEVTFVPGRVSWNFNAGWGYRFGKDNVSGVKYDFSEKEAILWANHDLGNKWTLRMERTPKSGHNEIGVRYKLHDFLSLEYVFDNDDSWLRVVGNL